MERHSALEAPLFSWVHVRGRWRRRLSRQVLGLRHEHEVPRGLVAHRLPHIVTEKRGGRVRVGHELLRKLACRCCILKEVLARLRSGERTCVDIAGEQVPLRHEQLAVRAARSREAAQRPQEGGIALGSECYEGCSEDTVGTHTVGIPTSRLNLLRRRSWHHDFDL